MTVTMDAAGRLVIPRQIRRQAALEPGMPLEVHVRNGVIEIAPQTLRVRFRRKGHLLIATPVRRVPVMKASIVERTRRSWPSRS